MPNRPIQHQLEDRSRAALRSAIPERWVLRDKSHDYGVDCEIEVFDAQGNATGDVLNVQIKATANPQEGKILRIRQDRLKYMRALPAPTLLVRWVATSGALYIRWAHALEGLPPSDRQISIKFSERDRWTGSTPGQIEHELCLFRILRAPGAPVPVQIAIHLACAKVAEVDSPLIEAELRAIAETLSPFLAVGGQPAAPLAEIALEPNAIQARIGQFAVYRITGYAKVSVDLSPNALALDALLALAAVLCKVGKYDLASRIFSRVAGLAPGTRFPGMAHIVATAFDNSHDYVGAMNLCEQLLQDRALSPSLDIIQQTIFRNSDALSASDEVLFEKLLKKQIRRATDDDDNAALAIAHYNLASHFRRSRLLSSVALKHYKAACQAFPDFKNQSVIWAEAGEMLLARRKGAAAKKAFERAYKLDAAPHHLPDLAEAHLVSGEYQQARNVLEQYFNEDRDPDAEACLLYASLCVMVDYLGLTNQSRRTGDATALVLTVGPNLTDDAVVKIAEEALELDALNYSCWAVLAHQKMKARSTADGAQLFLLAAVLAKFDAQAWAEAILSSVQLEDNVPAVPLMIEVACRLIGNRFVKELYDRVTQLGMAARPGLLSFFRHIVGEVPFQRPRPAVHILDVARQAFREGDGAALRNDMRYEKIYVQPLTGDAKIRIAFLLGRYSTRNFRLPPHIAEMFEQLHDEFRKKFGREPEDSDPIFFDPDAETPMPMDLKKVHQQTLEVMREANTPKHLVYIYEKTGRILSQESYERLDYFEKKEVDDAYDEFFSKRRKR